MEFVWSEENFQAAQPKSARFSLDRQLMEKELNEAILAERERCAKIAEHYGDWTNEDGSITPGREFDMEAATGREIAAAIRSGEK